MNDEEDMERPVGGILIRGINISDDATAFQLVRKRFENLGLAHLLEITLENDGDDVRLLPNKKQQDERLRSYDTLRFSEYFGLTSQNSQDLEKEILLCLLMGPVSFEFPSFAEFLAAIKIRVNIVEAARRTALAFHTSKIERPSDYWIYTEGRGFTLVPGKSLIEALRKATQPEASGARYAFSCYRATEYVILLAIAQELSSCNPELFRQLQQQWESRAIMSRQFHEVFLSEFGSMNEPLPARYYVPGDRLWFRNPDQRSADIDGYEGSWVFYLGNGLFSNFWERNKPFTLFSKCIEIYHWRHGACPDAEGNMQMDEAIVEQRVRETMRNPAEIERILDTMMRLRDPQEIYADGGCIDASREIPRYVCPVTSDIILPGNL